MINKQVKVSPPPGGKRTVNEREICLDVLMEVTENVKSPSQEVGGQSKYIHIILRNVLDKYAFLDKRERSFIARVSEGTIEYMLQLDAVINRYSKTKVSKMKPLIRNLLRISVYQLLYMDSVPDSAVCNEAVKLAVKRKFHGLKGFVNGVLRTISREKGQLEFTSLSERYSMPQWIVEMWTKEYGEEITEQILKAFLEPKKLYIRCNLTNCTVEQLEESLKNDGVMVHKAPYIEEALEISGFDTLYELESFQNGYFQVQDLSSMMVAKAASPKEGADVLDVCAAPGGKALHVADLLRGTGLVEARDLTEYKIDLIEDNIERAGFTNIRALQWDALEYDEEWEEKADIVIADLPCSGLGVIGKKMDIKYKTSPEQIQDLQKLQRNILDTVYKYVKPDGTLIYSTCTITRAENEENVRWLLDNYPLELVSLSENEGLKDVFAESRETLLQAEAGYIQLLPGIHKTDGFFIAKFRKKSGCLITDTM